MKLRTTMRAATALLLFASASQAFAQATTAGTDISNQATVSYTVGTTAQTPITSAPVTFKVDRKIDVVVTKVNDASVAPGATGEVLEYTVQNKTNDTIDILLSTGDAGGTFAATGVQVWVDGASAGWDGDEVRQAYLNNLAPDETTTVFILADIPSIATDTQTDLFWLIAEARDATGASSASPGAVFAESGTADDPNAVDNVLADADGPASAETAGGDGKHSALATFTVSSASIVVAKSYQVIFENYDTGTSTGTNYSDAGDLKPIPGALVQFCIMVTNTGASDATAVSVTDELGAAGNNISTYGDYLPGSIRVAADCSDYSAAAARTDDDADADGASFDSAGNKVDVSLGTVPATTGTGAAMFRVVLK